MKIKILTCAFLILCGYGCRKSLDVNTNPNEPQTLPSESLIPSVLTQMARGLQYDGAYLGRYIQNWQNVNASETFDRHGWTRPTAFEDPAGEIWRMTYYAIGRNLENIFIEAGDKKKWDYLGVAKVVRAWCWQTATDYHSDIIMDEAFTPDQYRFKYNTQEEVYAEVRRLCHEALAYLERTDGLVSEANLRKADFVYNGDREKWKKFVYGLLARNFHHLANKADYHADSVIYYASKALSTVEDDFMVSYIGSSSANANFYGTSVTSAVTFNNCRQSQYIVQLLDGTIATGGSAWGNRDPRMKAMLVTSPDTTNGNGGYRFLTPGQGDVYVGYTDTAAANATTKANAKKRVSFLWGDRENVTPLNKLNPNRPAPGVGRFLFKDDAKFPIMTSSEMQFILAEAYWKEGNKSAAHTAYKNGINLHFAHLNKHYPGTTIVAADQTRYMNNPLLVKADGGVLTLGDILRQKYIALWGWGFVETWVDLRRYHYTDAAEGEQVYKGFELPATFFVDNNGKPAYRFRPRWNSEYIWNKEALEAIGATAADYHTNEMWFSKP
jgi:hypothetical protein